MPTPSGHTTAILASKVRGTPVYNSEGDKIGTVEDVVLDKMSNNIMFAVLGSGRCSRMGEVPSHSVVPSLDLMTPTRAAMPVP